MPSIFNAVKNKSKKKEMRASSATILENLPKLKSTKRGSRSVTAVCYSTLLPNSNAKHSEALNCHIILSCQDPVINSKDICFFDRVKGDSRHTLQPILRKGIKKVTFWILQNSISIFKIDLIILLVAIWFS